MDPNALRQEAKVLFDKAKDADAAAARNQGVPQPSQEVYELKPEQYPPLIKKLAPKYVNYTQRGVYLLYFKWVSKQVGYFIPAAPMADPSPVEIREEEMREIKPGTYYWHISG